MSKTNDQLSGELANASLLARARALRRKRREEEAEGDDEDEEEEGRQNRFSL